MLPNQVTEHQKALEDNPNQGLINLAALAQAITVQEVTQVVTPV